MFTGGCDQVRHKPACSATETTYRLDIWDIETRGIILSRQGTTKALMLFAYCIRHIFSWPCSYNLAQAFYHITNQRTSGPVNAHLTPGPGIYFNAFIHVHSPRVGADNPMRTNVDVNRKPLSLCPFVAGCFEVRFYIHFFQVSPYIYSPGQGQTIHRGQNFDDNRKAFSLYQYVASFKMISSKSDFIHIFNDFIHVYSPGAKAENPLRTNFWCQQKALIISTICCKFQINLFVFWFCTHFLMFFHMYIVFTI